MNDLIVCNSKNKCLTIGTIFYDRVDKETILIIDEEMNKILKSMNKDYKIDTFVIYKNMLINRSNFKKIHFESEIIDNLVEWIYHIDNKPISKITYNWITSNHVNVDPNDSYYILTLTSDDYIGTYLNIECGSFKSQKDKSKKLYPDERNEDELYYDGGTLIYIPNNSKITKIKASNCIIFHKSD